MGRLGAKARLGLAIFSAGLALTGCSDAPKHFEPVRPLAGDQGVIYLYRPHDAASRERLGTILANGRAVVQIRDGGYFPYVAGPGMVRFQLVTSDPKRTLISKAAFRIEPGREKFLKIVPGSDRLKFAAVLTATARDEIRACERLDGIAPLPTAPRPPAPRRGAAASSRPKAEPIRVQGRFSFEAERLAIEHGCVTPDGVRPVAYLTEQTETREIYSVSCVSTTISVGCQFQYCERLE